MEWLARSAACVLALALVACGSDGSGVSNSSATGTAGNAGTAGTGGAAGSGGKASGGSSGSGGSAGMAAPDCTNLGSTNTYGSVDGTDLMENWSGSGARVPGDPWLLSNEPSPRGFELFRGRQMGDPMNLGASEQALEFGMLWAPTTSAIAGQVVCFEDATATSANPPQVELRTEAAKLLGSCPGEPISGELTLCPDGGLNCTQPVGSLDGETLDGTGFDLWGSSADPPNYSMGGRGTELAVMAYLAEEPMGGSSGSVDQAIIVTFADSPLGVAVYCAGEGSTFEFSTANGTRLVLKNLSKLGDCAGGENSLLLCR